MFNKIKKNAKVIVKAAGIGVATLAATAVEIAGSIEMMNKIVEGCDENNPANFGQTLGVVSVSIVAGAAETATCLGGMAAIGKVIEDEWQ